MNETKRINSSEAAAVDRMLDISSEQRDYSFSLDELKEVAVPQSKKRKKLSDVIKTEAAAVKWLKSMRLEEWDSCRLDELKALIQKFPGAIRVQDKNGSVLLRVACLYGCNNEIVQSLVDSWPESCGFPAENGELPLHLALQGELSSLETIQYLIQAWPKAVHKQDEDGFLPLHYACKRGGTDDVIRFLVQSWPMTVRTRTSQGSLPLQLAMRAYPSLSLKAIQVLVEAWPGAVREKDNDGFLPLHRAFEKGCADDVIQFLVRSWTVSCQIPTNDGQLPLHLACNSNEPSTVIRFLLDCYPQAVRFKNKKSQLPLHIACMRETALELVVMEHLIRAWPESTQIVCPCECNLDWIQQPGANQVKPDDVKPSRDRIKNSIIIELIN